MESSSSRLSIRFAHAVCCKPGEDVTLGPQIADTDMGKINFAARIVQEGGLEKVFRKMFSVGEEEKLVKVNQCSASTTNGPIAGLLFISTANVTFCSETSLKFTSPEGGLISEPFKLVIPLETIKEVTQSANADKPWEKYIDISTTVENKVYWFMGFVSYEKTFKDLQLAISSSQS